MPAKRQLLHIVIFANDISYVSVISANSLTCVLSDIIADVYEFDKATGEVVAAVDETGFGATNEHDG